jgi:hypothetical protein
MKDVSLSAARLHYYLCMRVAILLAMMLALTGILQPAVSGQRHPYVKHWKRSTFGKRPAAGVAARAGVAQLRNRPRQWGSGVDGFGKRLGAGFATHAVKTTVEHAVAAPLHEDLHYHRSNKSGVAPRLGHALTSSVVTRNTKTGRRTPAAGRISGHVAAGAVSQTALAGANAASTAGIGLAANAGANVAREFWPQQRRRGGTTVHAPRVSRR